MFAFLIRNSLRYRLFVLCGAAILVVIGTIVTLHTPVDVLPDIDRNIVSILTEGEGLAPQEVERRITFPIETAMAGLEGVKRVRSVSSPSLSLVQVDFKLGTDVYRDRQLVSERLSQARSQIPPDALPEMLPITSVVGEVVDFALTSDSGHMMALRDFVDWRLRPRLLAIPGIAQVLPVGGEVRTLRITPDPRRLEFLGVTLGDLETAVKGYDTNTGGSSVDAYGRRFLITNIGHTRNPAALLEGARDLVVAYQHGRPILLREVAKVDFAAAVKQGDASYMGQPAVLLRVQKQPGVNTLVVTARIKELLADMRPFLPKGVHVSPFTFAQETYINHSIDTLKHVLIEGALMVAVVLFAFLLNIRTTVISLAAIPISMFITVLVFHFAGLTINTMTLGGLAIAAGELVDDAVVGVENTYRRLRLNRLREEPRPVLRVIAEASVEVRTGIFYATLIVLLVFFPLFALPGIDGLMFEPLAVAYITSIFASLITSVTLTPVLAYYLLPQMKRMRHADSGLVRVLKRQNERLLAWAFANQATVVAAALLGVGLAAVGTVYLPRAFLPPLNEGDYLVEANYDPGISLVDTDRMARAAEKLLMKVPGVTSVDNKTGRSEYDLDADGIYRQEFHVNLASSADPAKVLRNVRAALRMLPRPAYISQPVTMWMNAVMTGLPSDLAVKIFGSDPDTLVKLANELNRRLASVKGLTDRKVEAQTRIPQLLIRPNPADARLYGVTPAKLTRSLETLAGGRIVSQVIDANRRYDVVVRLNDRDRTAAELRNLLIDTPVGHVPLRDLAEIRDTDGPNQIVSENGLPRIAVLANTDGSDMAAITRGIQQQIDGMRMPAGYSAMITGDYAAQQEATRLIAILSIISLILIFAILYTRYSSAVLALIIMANVPLALIGSIVALWIAGGSLSLATMIGFITLAGISTRNGILKISHYINLALNEGETFGRRLIVRGSLERMTPVLMTALSAGMALIPLILGGGEPGKEILSPVALVIFGGLVSATLLDAVLTPVLFLRFGEAPLRELQDRHEAGQGAEAY
ncbi:MAG TPA: efflux RND transporter permease subunit [Stellaceae bacterium]|nr:efflux RND transporter permease subunit [Stellaceae bacterium]